MSSLKQRRELGESMRKIESEMSRLNGELKSMKTEPLVGKDGYKVSCSCPGFDGEDLPFTVKVEPLTILSSEQKNEDGSKSGKDIQFHVTSLGGIISGAQVIDGKEKEIWSIELQKLPAEKELSIRAEKDGADKEVKIQVKVIDLKSLSAEIAAKENEVEELMKKRKQAKSEMAALQQQAAAEVAAASDSAVPSGSTTMPQRKSVGQKIMKVPVSIFRFGMAIYESPIAGPLKELLLFGGGVALLMYRGEDLAV